jgi:ABC-type transporter Mla MlaB component
LAVLEPRTIVLIIEGPIERAHIPRLCEGAGALIRGVDARHVVCDVGALVEPDEVTIEALARLQLTVGRVGCRFRVRHACEELRDLLTLSGLSDVIPFVAESGPDPQRKVEQREEPRGVEEEADPGDLTI